MCVGPPSPPKPQPPPAPPPVAPIEPASVPDDGSGSRARRRARVQAGGRRSTLMTGAGGVLGEPNVGRPTLLGG